MMQFHSGCYPRVSGIIDVDADGVNGSFALFFIDSQGDGLDFAPVLVPGFPERLRRAVKQTGNHGAAARDFAFDAV